MLIACVNIGNLLLARATIREKEMAIRHALGGSRIRLIRQVLAESVLLGAVGGGLGVVFAFWGVGIFLQLMPHNIPWLQDVRVDGTVMLFGLSPSLAASLLFGLAPGLRVRGQPSNDSLREGGRGAGEGARSRMRGLLVSGEIAAATILVAGAALMLQSFVHLAVLEPGFSPEHLLTADVMASLDRYSQPWQQAKFFNEVLAKIRARAVHSPWVLLLGCVDRQIPTATTEATPRARAETLSFAERLIRMVRKRD